MKFKVGNKVVVTNATDTMTITTNGSIGVIKSIDNKKTTALVYFSEYGEGSSSPDTALREWNIPLSTIELLKDKPKKSSKKVKYDIEKYPWGKW